MASLRELIFSGQQKRPGAVTFGDGGDDGLLSHHRKRHLPSSGAHGGDGTGSSSSISSIGGGVKLPTKRVAVIQPRSSRTPWATGLGRRAKALLPVYHASPHVRIETRRRWFEATNVFAPGCSRYWYAPRPESTSVNESSRKVCRGLWNAAFFSGDHEASIQVLHALVLLDSIDFDDVCKIIVALLDCGRLQELRSLMEELTRESSTINEHHPARRVVLLRTFCDFLALERADVETMSRYAERSPELADVQMAGLCVKCIFWGSKLTLVQSHGDKLVETCGPEILIDVINNISLFSNVVRSLNAYVSGDIDFEEGDFRNSSSSSLSQIISKREISNLLTQLGLALQSATHGSGASAVSVYIIALYAAFQLGMGQNEEAFRRITGLQTTYRNNPVANQIFVQFACTHFDLQSTSLFPALSSWVCSDLLSDAATILLMGAAQLEFSSSRLARCWEGTAAAAADPDAASLFECLCSVAEALPDVVTFEVLHSSMSTLLANSEQPSPRGITDFGPVFIRNLTISWCVWRSLACLLGPIPCDGSDARVYAPASLVAMLRSRRQWWIQSILCADRIPEEKVQQSYPDQNIGGNKNVSYVVSKVLQEATAESAKKRTPHCEKMSYCVGSCDLFGFGLFLCNESFCPEYSTLSDLFSSSFVNGDNGCSARDDLLSTIKRIGISGGDAASDIMTSYLLNREGGRDSSAVALSRAVVDVICFQAAVSAHLSSGGGGGGGNEASSFAGRVVELVARPRPNPNPHLLSNNVHFLRAMNLTDAT